MQNLPTAEVYEKEFQYMPWGILVKEVTQHIIEHCPENGKVLDLLCGPGYLLGKIKQKRADALCVGVDLEEEYIDYAKNTYSNITFIHEDVLTWESDVRYDVILCTGGLHHLDYPQHEGFIAKLTKLLCDDGFAIVADPYIDDYTNEQQRKLASAKLGYEYLRATIENSAPDDVLQATANLISNDVLKVEYKTSIKKIKTMFEKHFSSVVVHKTWPNTGSEYGDYYFIVKK